MESSDEKSLCRGRLSGESCSKSADSEYKRDAIERLVRFYEATGKAEQTAEWKQKLAAFTQLEAEKNSAR